MGFFSRLGDRFSDIGSRSSGSSSRSGFGSSSRSFRFSPMPPPAKYSIRSGIAALKSNSRSNSDTVSIGRQMKSSAPTALRTYTPVEAAPLGSGSASRSSSGSSGSGRSSSTNPFGASRTSDSSLDYGSPLLGGARFGVTATTKSDASALFAPEFVAPRGGSSGRKDTVSISSGAPTAGGRKPTGQPLSAPVATAAKEVYGPQLPPVSYGCAIPKDTMIKNTLYGNKLADCGRAKLTSEATSFVVNKAAAGVCGPLSPAVSTGLTVLGTVKQAASDAKCLIKADEDRRNHDAIMNHYNNNKELYRQETERDCGMEYMDRFKEGETSWQRIYNKTIGAPEDGLNCLVYKHLYKRDHVMNRSVEEATEKYNECQRVCKETEGKTTDYRCKKDA